MNNKTFNILLVEDNLEDTALIKEVLSGEIIGLNIKQEYKIINKTTLEAAREYLQDKKTEVDIILLDLYLPDSKGLETVKKLREELILTPIIVVADLDNHQEAKAVLRTGVQDYLIKDKINSELLWRSIRYSIERHKLTLSLQNLATVDELTGLYNRRGFTNLATRHLQLADRKKEKLALIYLDLDKMKYINDHFGHETGDKALITISNILQNTFRSSDLLARIGGDEFVVLAVGASEGSEEKIINRLKENIKAYNLQAENSYEISISHGVVYYEPQSSVSLGDLLHRADQLMYQQKKKKYKDFN